MLYVITFKSQQSEIKIKINFIKLWTDWLIYEYIGNFTLC